MAALSEDHSFQPDSGLLKLSKYTTLPGSISSSAESVIRSARLHPPKDKAIITRTSTCMVFRFIPQLLRVFLGDVTGIISICRLPVRCEGWCGWFRSAIDRENVCPAGAVPEAQPRDHSIGLQRHSGAGMPVKSGFQPDKPEPGAVELPRNHHPLPELGARTVPPFPGRHWSNKPTRQRQEPTGLSVTNLAPAQLLVVNRK